MKKIIQNKLGTYLAVTAGVGCAASVANAAVVFYGNASNTDILADPAGINIDFFGPSGSYVDGLMTVRSFFRYGTIISDRVYFTRGTDFAGLGWSTAGRYAAAGNFIYGAEEGDQNYANISFDGNDGVYEAVGQFYFDGVGGGYLMAIATTNAIPNPQDLSTVSGSALSISAGKSMIDAAAIPEPSSLVLLALGATGLAARRQRKKAA